MKDSLIVICKQGSLILKLLFSSLFFAAVCLLAAEADGLGNEQIQALSSGTADQKIDAVNRLAFEDGVASLPILKGLEEGNLYSFQSQKLVLIKEEQVFDAVTGQEILPAPPQEMLEKITINNKIRQALGSSLALLQLFSPDPKIRLFSAEKLEEKPDPKVLPLIQKALKTETDSRIRSALSLAEGSIQIQNPDPGIRLQAVLALGKSDKEYIKMLLQGLLARDGNGNPLESDPGVRLEIQKAIQSIDQRLLFGEYLGRIFAGISLGSILLLVALGLAIIYGLMGVINMAHGEFLMIGAYTTYMAQVLTSKFLPGAMDYYMIFAVPSAFFVAAGVGILLERAVIRFLYGRPLETLLATWGVSLILIQTVRMIFGAQNVEVKNPSWMSGGFPLLGNLVLPYNRMVIILFSFAILIGVWFLLIKTRFGLFIRAITQNRSMASCVGVQTGRTDMWAFGMGAGIAGLAGCALSQIGNVGPELGQSYIVDAFLVVVLGGVGQIAGTAFAAVGLGILNKFIEPVAGAVLAKIFILVLIILVIQKFPQGLFALKGRSEEKG